MARPCDSARVSAMRALWWTLLCVGWLATAGVRADGVLLEPTYALLAPLFLRGGESALSDRPRLVPYTMEASISLHVPLTSSFEQLAERDGWAHAFTFIPRIDLRHAAAESFPIRTPSYYPTLRFQTFYQWRHGASDHARVVLELVVAHLSNGQDGCLIEERSGERGCLTRSEVDGAVKLNHRDGSFASNELGVRVGVDHKRGRWKLASLLGLVLFRPYTGGTDPELRAFYGLGRGELWLRAGRTLALERSEAELGVRARVDLRVGGAALQEPLSATIDGFARFSKLRDWGPFLRLRVGSDGYNVRFDVPIVMLAAGLIWQA